MKGKQNQGKKDEERKEKGNGKQKERDGTRRHKAGRHTMNETGEKGERQNACPPDPSPRGQLSHFATRNSFTICKAGLQPGLSLPQGTEPASPSLSAPYPQASPTKQDSGGSTV